MLVLSRKLGERVFVGDFLTITVTDIDRGKVRLGFECDPAIAIYREELYNQVEQTRLDSERLWKEHNARSQEADDNEANSIDQEAGGDQRMG